MHSARVTMDVDPMKPYQSVVHGFSFIVIRLSFGEDRYRS
uniref:Uncharacterized protein n=1 Tax=Rhizobium rhizogenes TaxID=359 RepID=A0A4P8DKC4_RHIRH|nr:hypothetical protein pOC-C5.8_632 [Rhizobium rhizogenes]